MATDCRDKKKKKKTVDPVGDTDIDDLLEKPKDAPASAAPPKTKKQRVVKF